MNKLSPDLVLTYTIKPNIWGAFAASSRGIDSVAMVTGLGYAFTNVGLLSLKSKVIRLIAARLYRAATNRNRTVIFQNPDDRDDFIAEGCLRDVSKARLVNGSGVDIDYYSRSPLPNYGPDGISEVEVEEWIEAGTKYLGAKDDVRPALQQARVFVLPSYREGTPRSVLEAMAMGRPVITSDAPGCRETVRDHVEGYLVPVCDPRALSKAMLDMLANPDQVEKMADSAHRRARERFSVSVVNAQMFKALGIDD